MNAADVLVDGFDRVQKIVGSVLDGLQPSDVTARINGESNSIAWLIWHLTRIQDDHIAGVAGTEQVWTSAAWFTKFDLPFDPSSTGYGHTSEDVGAVKVESTKTLVDYHNAVHDATVPYLRRLTDHDLNRVVDMAWDPPVTLGVRLISVLSDNLQHVGQAAFAKGIIQTPKGA